MATLNVVSSPPSLQGRRLVGYRSVRVDQPPPAIPTSNYIASAVYAGAIAAAGTLSTDFRKQLSGITATIPVAAGIAGTNVGQGLAAGFISGAKLQPLIDLFTAAQKNPARTGFSIGAVILAVILVVLGIYGLVK